MGKPYEHTLCADFRLSKIPFEQQSPYNFIYKNVKFGRYIPGLTVFEEVIVEIKTIDRITRLERGQVLNDLRAIGYKVGLIMNFKRPRLEWERLIL